MPVPMGARKVERRPLRETVGEQIKQAILDGTFKPGEILNDEELREWLGVSRSPIREALNDLARVGLVEMAAQRYTRVAQPSPENRVEILQTLGVLLGGVSRIVVTHVDNDDLALVLPTIDAVIEAVHRRDAKDHGEMAWKMIDQLVGLCPNAVLLTTTRDSIDALAYRLSITSSEIAVQWEALSTTYPEFRDAVASGDAIAAELAIESLFLL